MKLHLPIALLMACFGGVLYADATPSYTTNAVDENKDGIYDSKVTTTYTGDWYSGVYLDGISGKNEDGLYTGGAVTTKPSGSNYAQNAGAVGPLPFSTETRTATSAETIITGEGTSVYNVYGSGPNGYTVTGDKTITVKDGAFVDFLYGATYYNSSSAYRGQQMTGGITGSQAALPAYDAKLFAPKAQADENGKYPVISINIVDGGTVGDVYGASYLSSNVGVAELNQRVANYEKQGMTTADAKAAVLADMLVDTPWAINEEIKITVGNRGEVQYSIWGGGGYSASVNNKVSVTIEDGGLVRGNIFTGASGSVGSLASQFALQNYVDSTHLTINGGQVNGDFYGGGSYDSKYGIKTVVREDTLVEVNGGVVNGRVFGGGARDEVWGNTKVILRGGTVNNDVYATGSSSGGVHATVGGDAEVVLVGEGTKVTGTIYGKPNDNVKVNGTTRLTIGTLEEAYTGTHELKIAAFDEVAITQGSAANLCAADGTTLSLQDIAVTSLSNAMPEQVAELTLGSGILVDEAAFTFTVIVSDTDLTPGNSFTLDLLRLVDGNIDTYAINALELDEVTTLDSSLVSFISENGEEITMQDVVLSRNTEGAVTTYSVSATTIPEPTTATLSLLALAGLAARRRRK